LHQIGIQHVRKYRRAHTPDMQHATRFWPEGTGGGRENIDGIFSDEVA
tara:strand:- start:8144 stop:8287 length:144 start_codon:yes stop_codon:yes gene_type:complete